MTKSNMVTVKAKSFDGEFLTLNVWGNSNLATSISRLSPEDSVTFIGEYKVIA